MNFQQITACHENARRVFEDGLWVEWVDFPELAAFDAARRAFADSVKHHSLQGPWMELVELFKFVHARAARTPCRPSWLLEQENFRMLEEKLEPQLQARLGSVDPSVREAFDRAKDALRVLAKVETNPVALAARKLLRIFGAGPESIVVISDTRIWDECREQLSQQILGVSFKLRKPIELRDHPAADYLILFGPPWLLKYRNELFLLGSPVAPSVWFVLCSNERSGLVTQSLLEEGDVHALNAAEPSAVGLEIDLEHEPKVLFQPHAFALKHGQESGGDGGPEDTLSALPLILGGGKGIYIQDEGGLYTAITRADGEKRPCLAVERVDAPEIEPGMLVLLTTEGGGDMIPVVADMLLNDEAKAIRELELLWKRRLKDEIERQGLAVVADCLDTSPQNVRNWCDPRNIAPEKLVEHLLPILELVGLRPRYQEIVEAIGRLRRAHRIAAKHLHKLLRRSLQGRDLREAYVRGFQEIRDKAGGPVKTVYLVQDVKESEEVSIRLVGRILDLEDEAP
jgi:hypothetical protein